jgi:hypothetical protein
MSVIFEFEPRKPIPSANTAAMVPSQSTQVTELLKFLNTLFSEKVLIAHDLREKTSRILTPKQAEDYIENFFPVHLLAMAKPYDESGNILDWYSPRRLLHWYEAEDTYSRMEIRYPLTGEEFAMSLGSLHFRRLWTTTTTTSGHKAYFGGILNDPSLPIAINYNG